MRLPTLLQNPSVICMVVFLATLAPPRVAIAEVMASPDPGPGERLANGAFANWHDGRPTSWHVTVGATENDGPTSSLTMAADPATGDPCLRLSGDASTRQWLAASQMVAVEPGQIFRLAARLRAHGLRPDEHRFKNYQVAVMAKAPGGQIVNTWSLLPDTTVTDWVAREVHLQAPLGGDRLDVVVFLSVGGVLEVDDVSLQLVPRPAIATAASREERWLADIRYLAEWLPRLHVDPFTMTTAEDFADAAADLEAGIGDLDDLQLNLRLMALCASLGDAHTSVGLVGRPQRLPVQFEFFDDDLRLLAVDRACAALAGGRVTEIGGRALADVLADVRLLVACETESWFRRQAPQLLRIAEVVTGLGLVDGTGALPVTVIGEDGDPASCAIAPAAGRQVDFEVCEAPADCTPLYLSNRSAYWYRYLPESRTCYLQYNRCREDPGQPLAAFMADVIACLDAEPVHRFVLDLRFNSGGSSGLLQDLFAAVAERHSDGRLAACWVITGRATFSAACLDALDFRLATGARVAGEPMGNKPNRFGQLNALTLPASGLQVQYATKRFRRLPGDPPMLAPDLPVTLGWEDYLAGRDPVLDLIVSLWEN
jgi:hypothetical protein